MSGVTVRQLSQMQPRWKLSDEERNFGSLKCQHGMLPLEDLKLQGAIRGLDFSLKLTQVFVNVHPQTIEAVYIFPLPARAAVSAFTMSTKDREVKGVLQERGQARANYAQAISEGKQAALVEEERPEIFTMTVGNLPAGERVTVELELDGPLTCIDDTALFRFPLVVAPKYIPGKALSGNDVGSGSASDTERVPDASRISPPVLLPGYPNPVRLSIEIEMDSPLLDWQQLEASLPFQIEQATGKKRRRAAASNKLVYLPQAGRIDHDLVLAFPFHPNQMRTSLQVLEPEASVTKSEPLPFCLTMVPPAVLSDETAEKQVVVLLDRSGSMQGWKMAAAIRTVARLIDSLNSDDSFSILAFDDRIDEIRPTHIQDAPRSQNWFKLNQANLLVEANDRNRCDYNTALKAVTARGGTEIAMALEHALQKFGASRNESEIDRHIVLVTDGQVGNEAEIIDYLKREAKGVKVSTVGIDQAVNQAFLERIASTTQGLCQVVLSDEQLDRSMTQICRRIGNPVLKNVQLEGCKVEDLVFQHNDLYAGIATRIYGRMRGPIPEKLNIVAEKADGSRFVQEVEVDSCVGTIEKLWARERVLQMEHEFLVAQQGRDTQALVKETTAFSLLYGVLCRFTAFLAVDHESHVPTQVRTVVQAVENPAGWAAAAPGAGGPPTASLKCRSMPSLGTGMLKNTFGPSEPSESRMRRSSAAPPAVGGAMSRDMPAPQVCRAPAPRDGKVDSVLESLQRLAPPPPPSRPLANSPVSPTKMSPPVDRSSKVSERKGFSAGSSGSRSQSESPTPEDKSKLLELLKSLLESLNSKAAQSTVGAKIREILDLSACFQPELASAGELLLQRIETGEQVSYDSIKVWVLDIQKTQETKPGFFGRILGTLRKK